MSPASPLRGTLLRLSLVVACVAGLSVSAAAQTPAPGIGQGLPEDDFLFKQPRGGVGLRGMLVIPQEGSDIFSFVQEQLTIEPGDFMGPGFMTEISFAINPRIDIAGTFDYAQQTVSSEYRNFVDNSQLPIEQDTSLRQSGLTASLRLALTPRGRPVGRFAWIPARFQPFVGAGGGLLFWQFKQAGDFVDFQDLRVFPDTFVSSGTAPSAHVLGGADIQIHKRLFFAAEGRFTWATGDLEGEYIGFDPIDLSGLRVSAGINFVF